MSEITCAGNHLAGSLFSCAASQPYPLWPYNYSIPSRLWLAFFAVLQAYQRIVLHISDSLSHCEAGLVIIQSIIPARSFEANMANLSTILLGRCESHNVRPRGIIHHLKNFGIDLLQLRILKLQRWNHILSVVGLELDVFVAGVIHLFKKIIIEPSASVQILR